MQVDGEDDIVMDADQSPNWVPKDVQNTYQFNRFVRMLLASGISYRHGAKIGNALVKDLVNLGFLDDDSSLLFTKSKIESEANRIGKLDAEQHLQDLKETKIVSIGHDGKASKTLQPNCKVKVESKVTIINNVERSYMTHEIPVDGTGEELANCLYKVSFETHIRKLTSFLAIVQKSTCTQNDLLAA